MSNVNLSAARRFRWLSVAERGSLTLVAVAAGGPAAAKQRVVINGSLEITRGGAGGTFKFVPLTTGALKRDSGTFTARGNLSKRVIRRNGQTVSVAVGTDSYVGANGTLNVSVRSELAAAGRNYFIETGTWRVTSGTGAYEGYQGGGAYASAGTSDLDGDELILPPTGKTFFREEGYLTKG